MKADFTKKLENLNELFTEKMKEWKVPGTAVGIIKDGEIVHIGELGLKDVEKNLGVTQDTIFAIGSASKSFTSMAVAILVDEGKLDWDTPVKKYIPEFEMFDKVAGERITVRDMLCHRSGLPRHEFMWYNAPFTRKELVERVKYLEPNKDFRSVMQYNNQMFTTAGYLVQVVSGMTWEDFVRTRIFEPLGMNNSNFSVEVSKQSLDYGLPYTVKEEAAIRADFVNIDIIGPAGSINSNLVDMFKWLKLLLNKGNVNGVQIVSEANLEEMYTIHMPSKVMPLKFNEVESVAYGLGWFIETYRGKRVINHGGNIDGFSALVSFIPSENLGVIILSNLNSNITTYAQSYYAYDLMLGMEYIDWSSKFKDEFDKLKEQAEVAEGKVTEEKAATVVSNLSHPLKDYTGVYNHPGYGLLKIEEDGGKLKLTFNNLEFEMKHEIYDIFTFEMTLLGATFTVMFNMDCNGNFKSVSIPFEPTVKEIVFERN